MTANTLPKILIMAGGTGGHVYPALSVAKKLVEKQFLVEWLGTARGIENRLVPENNYPLHHVSISGLRGKGIMRWLLMPGQLLRAVFQAISLIRRLKPDVVLGLGGFASGPGGLAAWLLNKPLVVHEQNAVAGTTNRWLNKLSTKSLQAFPNSLRGAETVGNPLRDDIVNIAPPSERFNDGANKPRLLILGGSLGALTLNQTLPEALALIDEKNRPAVWHQTGSNHHQLTMNLYQRFQVQGRVEPYIDDMHEAYIWADIIVCRAGALTVSEVAAVGLPAIFVPYPHAIDDHQTKNANYLVEAGAAVVVDEKALSAESLSNVLQSLLDNQNARIDKANKARELGVTNAAEKVADVCEALAHG